MAVAARLGHDEQRQAAVDLGPIGVGAGEQREGVGAGAERAPGLHAIDHPAGLAAGSVRTGGGDGDAGHVAAVVGFGHGDRGHHLGRCELRQPLQLLLLGATFHEGPGEDLRARDQRSTDAQAGPRQFFGGDDHRRVLGASTFAEAAVLRRHAEPERAELGEAGDDLLGHVAIGPVHVLGVRDDDVVGERPERVGHHVHLVVEMSGPGLIGERTEEVGVAELPDERMHRRQRIPLGPPVVLAAEDLRRQVVQHVGGVGAGDPRLEVALGAVVEQRACGRHAGRRVGHVVGQHLGGVRPAEFAQPAERLGHDPVGEVDRIGGGGYVGSGEHRLVLRRVVVRRHRVDVTGR